MRVDLCQEEEHRMKWYKAALQGGAQRYMDVTAQERSYAAEQALRDADLTAAAKASNNENSMMFGDKKFTWRDPGDILGGDWQEKKARVDDFSGFLKDNFYTNNIFDQTKWDTFKNGDPTAADSIKNEWTSSLEAWMYPNPATMGESTTAQKFNTYEYDWIEPWDEMYSIALNMDKPREPESTTGVTMIQGGANDGKNIEELFDVVPDLTKTTAPKDAIVMPDEKIHLDETKDTSMINVMMPVLRNQQFGGYKFKSKADYYRTMKENPDMLFTANVLWNYQNDRKGWGKIKTFEELAQIAIRYNKSHDEMIANMNMMVPKFSVTGQGTTQRTVTENAPITTSEKSKSEAALAANDRLQDLGGRLLDAYDKSDMTGLTLSLFNIVEGVFGTTGQVGQISDMIGDYKELQKEEIGGIDKDATGFLKNFLMPLQKDFQEASAKNQKIESAVAIRYLQITLAFNLALAEQGGGGGRAISDQDFKYALDRVGKRMWTSSKQSKEKVKLLMSIASKDFLAAKIRASSDYTGTYNKLTEYWINYKNGFEKVKNQYIHQLKGNYFFGELRIQDPANPTDERGKVQDYYLRDREDGGQPERVPYMFNGRLAALMAYDYGETPDVNIKEKYAQGLWSSMTEGERAIIRPTQASIDLLDKLIMGSSGYKDRAQLYDPKNVIKPSIDEGNNIINTDILESEINQYNDPVWWETQDKWAGKVDGLKRSKTIYQQDVMTAAMPVLTKLGLSNVPIIRDWENLHEYEDEKRRKRTDRIYNEFLNYLNADIYKHVGDKFREPQYEYIMKIINSIAQMTEAIDRGGPKVE